MIHSMRFAAVAIIVLTSVQPVTAQFTWTGAGAGPPNFDPVNWSNPFNWQNNSVPVSSATTSVTFGSGAVSVNNLGTISLLSLTFNTPMTLSGGSFQFGPSTVGYVRNLSGATVTVANDLQLNNELYVYVSTGTLNLTGRITGNFLANDTLIVQGSGVTILANGGNTYGGGTIVNSGVVAVSGDSNLGISEFGTSTPVTVYPSGSLRYTASTVSGRTFNLNGGALELSNNATLTLSGATVNGGYMRGGGTYALTAGTFLNGVTTFNSTQIIQSGPLVLATATLANFTNGGSLTNASGQTLNWNGGINQASGILTIGGAASVSDFTHYGMLSIPAGGVMTNTGSSSLVLGGGSTTFVGTQAAPGGVINVGARPMLVRGGLLVNNGSVGNSSGTGQVIVDYGGLAKGAGYYDSIPVTQNGGRFSPGNSPGRVTVGSVTMNPGGIYDFEINNATGVAGPTGTTNLSGWDLTLVNNQINPASSHLTVTATHASPFTINLITLRNPSPPDIPDAMANFNPNQAMTWLAFDVNPAGSVTNWDPTAIVINTSQVMNAFTGTFAITRDSGNPFQFYITYTPVSEPEMVFGVAITLVAGVGLRRRWKVGRRDPSVIPN